jgi:D-glycero-alpha-D-manno-heptose 1-phosphate guanylyltransferase
MNECIVLAGGFGTRLQQVVKDVPKCMAEVAGKPFLYHLFGYLSGQPVSHVILSLGYKAETVIKWLNTMSLPFEVSYIVEDEPLGTGGAVKLAMSKVRERTAFVVNGDTCFNVDMSRMKALHETKDADITLALKPMRNFDRYGSVKLDGENRIIDFIEKKQCNSGLINGGVYLVKRELPGFDRLSGKFSFEKDILEDKSLNLNLLGYVDDGYFIDIGIPADFEKANRDFK